MYKYAQTSQEENTIGKLLKNWDLKSEAEARLNQLYEVRKNLQPRLVNVPDGMLHIVRKGNRIQYYLRTESTDKSGKYLSREKQKLVPKLLRKSYNEKVLKLVEKEIRVLERFLRNYQDFPIQIRKIYSDFPDQAKEFLTPIDMSDEDYIAKWKSTPFITKGVSDGETNFISEQGERVRSKSELNIANTLYKLGIPYRYECPLEIRNGLIIYPDFTILNVKKREVYYWEHRGMMDDREYAKHSVSRMKDYARSGIFPGKGLILTEETMKTPLGNQEIQDIIRAYFE